MAKATQEQNQTSRPVGEAGFILDLQEHIRSGYQAIYVCTAEESRIEGNIKEAAHGIGMRMVTWDCWQGFSESPLKEDQKLRNPERALDALVDNQILPQQDPDNNNIIFVFRDLDDFTEVPMIRRRLRSLIEWTQLANSRYQRPIVILSPVQKIEPKLRAHLPVIEYELPDENRMDQVIAYVQACASRSSEGSSGELPESLRERIRENLLGMTAIEAENCVSRCLTRHETFKEEMLKDIKDEKAKIIKQSQVLTYIDEDSITSRDEIGGFDAYMEWLDRRRLAYSRQAREENIDFPKGVVLLGIPGSGKSIVGRATCKILQLPGYVLDVGSVFGSLVGQSEQRMREAIKQIEAQKGCVLVIDEADKAFGNAHNSQGDSGVTQRVFGTFLTWLAEKQSRTFVIMTLNRTKNLPPEFLRTGRFDAMFYTDLPDAAARREILEIHLRKRGVDPATLDLGDPEWEELASRTEEFVGSELEELVREARYISFEKRGTGRPSFEELIEAAAGIQPMTVRDATAIQEIRDFCKNQGRPVSKVRTRSRSSNKRQQRRVKTN